MGRLRDGLRVDRALSLVWAAAPRWTVASFVLLTIQALVPLATLYLVKLAVDRLSEAGPSGHDETAFVSLMVLLGMAFAVTLLGNLCTALQGYVGVVQGHLVADRMQHIVQVKSIDLDLEHYESPKSQDILHRAQHEAPSRPLRIIQGLTQVGRSGLTLLGAFLILLGFHWSIVAAVFLAASPVVFYRFCYAHAMYEWHRDKTMLERISAYINRVLTTLDGAKEVRTYGFGPALMQRFESLRKRIRSGVCRITAQHNRRQFVTESVATIAGYVCLVWVAHEAWVGTISLGDTAMYFGAFQIALASLRPLLSGVGELYENNLYLSTLYDFLAVPRRVREPDQPKAMPDTLRAGFRIEALSFQYPGMKAPVLRDIQMAIAPGETVALVGRNGSGKSTLVKLICRLYDPSSGRITIDGIDLRELATADLRRHIAVMFQDFGRYQLSARENIWLGRSELDQHDPAIVFAAKQAGIHDEITALPDGYDTVMGRSLTNGAELSLGQWQKLALARAFARDPRLIILDEPTSSLDAAAEFEFFERFRSLAKGRSALIISHRFSTVSLADRIYVLDQGRLIEEGTHERLLAQEGLYASLYRKQASYYQSASSA